MSRPLTLLPAEPARVLPALRSALSGGSAVAVLADGTGTDASGLATGTEASQRVPLARAFAPEPWPLEVAQRVALVVETSGSSGRPKRVALSADALLSSAAAVGGVLGGHGSWLLALPVHYIAGLNVLVRSITAETEPVVVAASADARAFAAATAEMGSGPRFTSLVPTQLARLLSDPIGATALSRFDRILVGGQAISRELLQRAADAGVRVVRSYGSSETAGGCVFDGVAMSGVDVRIVDGEVQIAGPILAEGYLGDDALTATRFVAEHGLRWYHTGDTGTLDRGILTVTGRSDDVIISGGIKVSLAAVEAIVRDRPGQAGAIVVSSDDAEWGEVGVVVTTTPCSLEELRTEVRARLGAAAAPARIVVVREIPLLATGKPDRAAARELAR